MIKKRQIVANNEPITDVETERGQYLFSGIESKSWIDKAKEVLDIMDSRGINIYDPNNFGGMYLKGAKRPQKIKGIFKKTEKDGIVNTIEVEKTTSKSNLFAHLKNKNK